MSEGKPRVTVKPNCAMFIMHRPGGWRKYYLSDQIEGWTELGFTQAWTDALRWARAALNPTPERTNDEQG